MQRTYRFLTGVLSLALAVFTLSACDSVDSDSQGRVRVLLTDAPLDDVAEARVTIQRVELIGDDDEVIVLSSDALAFDLLQLRNGITAPLADVVVPAGEYDQVRLIVADEATLVFTDGTSSRLKIPSGAQSGIKIDIPDFVIENDNDTVEIVVDFDASRSFVRAGNSGKYIFKPVIKAKSMRKNDEDQEVDDDAQITGVVSEVGAGYFVVDGNRFVVDEHTRFEGFTDFAEVAVGVVVEVEFVRFDDGTLHAVEVERRS